MRLLFTFLMLTSCGSSHSDDATITPTGWVLLLKEKYAALLKIENEARAFGKWEEGCDWLLFAGLTGSVEGASVPSIKDAEIEPGKWLRRPVSKGDCFPLESKSQISKDMFLGVFWYAYARKDLAMLERIAEYAKAHNNVMGEPFPEQSGRVVILPQLPLLYSLIYSLGGQDNPTRKLFPHEFPADGGFGAHLQVLAITLRAKVESIPESSYNVLQKHAEREPDNAMFCAATVGFGADPERCANLLLDKRTWPDDRLPTRGDHCEFWPYQRDKGADWEPCDPKDEQLSVGGFLFVADQLLRRVTYAISDVR